MDEMMTKNDHLANVDNPTRILFALTSYGGWGSFGHLMRRTTALRGDVEAHFAICRNNELPFMWRMSSKQIRREGKQRFFFSPIFRGRAWGRDWLRQNWSEGAFDAVFVVTQHLGLGFVEELPPEVPIFVGMDFTFRRPVRHDRCLFAHEAGEALEQRVFDRATRIYPLSQWAANSVVEDYGIPEERVQVVPPSYTISDYPEPRPRESGAPLRVGFIGNPFREKGGEDLLDVHQRFFQDRVHLEIVSRAYRPQPGDRNVTHWPTVEHNTLLQEIVPNWDVFCLPTHHDMSSFATAEAHVAGIPAVTTRTGGVPEICIDGQTGFIVEPHDREALAERLSRLIDDADLRDKMGKAARQHALDTFNAQVNYNRVLDQVVEAAGSPARNRASIPVKTTETPDAKGGTTVPFLSLPGALPNTKPAR
jgi:glycosyltransferase involved in cell wall biosynthesis